MSVQGRGLGGGLPGVKLSGDVCWNGEDEQGPVSPTLLMGHRTFLDDGVVEEVDRSLGKVRIAGTVSAYTNGCALLEEIRQKVHDGFADGFSDLEANPAVAEGPRTAHASSLEFFLK